MQMKADIMGNTNMPRHNPTQVRDPTLDNSKSVKIRKNPVFTHINARLFKKLSKRQIAYQPIFMRHNVSFDLHVSNRYYLQNYGNGSKIADVTFSMLFLDNMVLDPLVKKIPRKQDLPESVNANF